MNGFAQRPVAWQPVYSGIGLDQAGIAERLVRCAIMRVTRIEDLQAA